MEFFAEEAPSDHESITMRTEIKSNNASLSTANLNAQPGDD